MSTRGGDCPSSLPTVCLEDFFISPFVFPENFSVLVFLLFFKVPFYPTISCFFHWPRVQVHRKGIYSLWYTPLSGRVLKGRIWEGGDVSATQCSGTPSCGMGSRMRDLHESQKASGGRRPVPGLVESVVGEVGEEEAVRSAGGSWGTWMGVLKRPPRRPGASTLAETPPSSDSDGAAGGCWRLGRGAAEEGAAAG